MTDKKHDIKGEGNPEADRRYREGVRKTVKSGTVEQKAREAANASGKELEEMRKAEEKARKRAK